MSYLGQPIRRLEDHRLLMGESSYVDDINLPDMLHAAIVRSPHAHARIRSIDASAARGIEGVVAVLTGEDIEGELRNIPSRAMEGEWAVDEFNAPEQPALAQGKVFYVGQVVAVVVAELKNLSTPVVGRYQMAHVASISANNTEIGELLGDILDKVGPAGVVTVEESKGVESAPIHTFAVCFPYFVAKAIF